MGVSRLTVVAGIVLAVAGCATSSQSAPDTASDSEAGIAAALLSHCSRGCPEGAPAGNEEVRHAFYTLSNNPATKFADWVAYIVDPELIGGPDRPRNWKADPDLDAADTLEPDDYDSISQLHMDRGHQAPLESFTHSAQWREANYLSNITPQDLNLNRGRWARLEKAERDLAEAQDAMVFVVTGPLYEDSMDELPEADEPHRIPSGYWKVVSMRNGGAAGFIFSQAPEEGTYCDRIAPLSEIESRSGLDLFPDTPNPGQMDLGELGCRSGRFHFVTQDQVSDPQRHARQGWPSLQLKPDGWRCPAQERRGENRRMKLDKALAAVSITNIALMSLHLSQDVVYGYEPANINNVVGVLILFVWLYATLMLVGRRSGYVILLLGSLFAGLMPFAHLSGKGIPDDVLASPGGLFFLWGVMALGVLGSTGFMLAAHGLWRLKRGVVDFLLWLVVPVVALAGVLLAYLTYGRG